MFPDAPLETVEYGTVNPKWYNTYTQYTCRPYNLSRDKATLKHFSIKNLTFPNTYANLSYMFYNCINLET
jgi:hypothetical protein